MRNVSGCRRRADAPAIPTADVEYDIDCEWSPDGRVYLWGALRTEGAIRTYTPFLDLTMTDVEAEFDLLVRFLLWLDDQIGADLAAGHTTEVFYYSPAEQTQIKRVTDAVGRPLPELRAQASPERIFAVVGECSTNSCMRTQQRAPSFSVAHHDLPSPST